MTTKRFLRGVALILVTGCSGSPLGAGAQQNPDAGAPDAGLGCCPTTFGLYSCQHADGSSGIACHNPAMGCASSSMCGQGCDPEVTGRCQCVQNVLCVVGSHFDTSLCQRVADTSTSACITAADCSGVLPALCVQCADGGTGCAHFVCTSGTCEMATCS